jgi:sec-independent protein translocase protein TatC
LDYFPSADAYISFVVFFLISTGIAFEMPVVLYGQVRLHILSTDLLRKQRRYFYFAMFVFAEIITPVSDPIVAPLTITVPLVLLYEITLFIARIGERQRERAMRLSPPPMK